MKTKTTRGLLIRNEVTLNGIAAREYTMYALLTLLDETFDETPDACMIDAKYIETVRTEDGELGVVFLVAWDRDEKMNYTTSNIVLTSVKVLYGRPNFSAKRKRDVLERLVNTIADDTDDEFAANHASFFDRMNGGK